jgi:hypothetical protein
LHNEKYLEFLRSENRPHQLLLEAWSCIEFTVDQVVTRQFGINCEYFDKKVQFLVNSGFGRKLEFLKKLNILDLDEYQMIHKFQEDRNKFFHTLSMRRIGSNNLSDIEQKMDEWVSAGKLSFDILRRPTRPEH